MRQLEGYSSITPIAIDDTRDLRKQVDQLSPGDIALFGTDLSQPNLGQSSHILHRAQH